MEDADEEGAERREGTEDEDEPEFGVCPDEEVRDCVCGIVSYD